MHRPSHGTPPRRLLAGLAVASALTAAVTIAIQPAAAQTTASAVSGAGAGALPAGTTYNGVPLAGLHFGVGAALPDSGQLAVTLLGSALAQGREIAVEGKVTTASLALDGVATLSGSCSVDMADGTPPLLAVPFVLTVTPGGVGTGGVRLTLGTTALPAVTLARGRTAVK